VFKGNIILFVDRTRSILIYIWA